ncbi:hypothetical protein [Polaromonas sp. YR568]|uniref:hypothetical protein n=1 Tax=Polaromonas sp. YR568 TaxID=1855301 RepID=UPI002717C859|nr:hypothetical protein [Polaromonas sp.]
MQHIFGRLSLTQYTNGHAKQMPVGAFIDPGEAGMVAPRCISDQGLQAAGIRIDVRFHAAEYREFRWRENRFSTKKIFPRMCIRQAAAGVCQGLADRTACFPNLLQELFMTSIRAPLSLAPHVACVALTGVPGTPLR